MTGKILYYYNTTATDVKFNVSRVVDGYIWDTTEEDFVAPAETTWTDSLIDATEVTQIGAWDVELPDVDIDKGFYQLAVYADPGATPSDPDMGVVLNMQSTGDSYIVNIK
jgi:hypothetical protein